MLNLYWLKTAREYSTTKICLLLSYPNCNYMLDHILKNLKTCGNFLIWSPSDLKEKRKNINILLIIPSCWTLELLQTPCTALAILEIFGISQVLTPGKPTRQLSSVTPPKRSSSLHTMYKVIQPWSCIAGTVLMMCLFTAYYNICVH